MQGSARDTHPLLVQILSVLYSFRQKFCKIITPWEILNSPLWKSSLHTFWRKQIYRDVNNLICFLNTFVCRYKDTIFPEHRPKRHYIRKTGRRWIHDQQQVPVYPSRRPYERDMWYHSTPTKYSPSYYSQPMYMTTQTGYSHPRQPFF